MWFALRTHCITIRLYHIAENIGRTVIADFSFVILFSILSPSNGLFIERLPEKIGESFLFYRQPDPVFHREYGVLSSDYIGGLTFPRHFGNVLFLAEYAEIGTADICDTGNISRSGVGACLAVHIRLCISGKLLRLL